MIWDLTRGKTKPISSKFRPEEGRSEKKGGGAGRGERDWQGGGVQTEGEEIKAGAAAGAEGDDAPGAGAEETGVIEHGGSVAEGFKLIDDLNEVAMRPFREWMPGAPRGP